jgi:hypothetical protein
MLNKLLIVIGILLLCNVGYAEWVVDQENLIGIATDGIGDINNNERRRAQSFTLSGEGDKLVGRVSIKHADVVGSPTGQLTIQIQTNNEGLPSRNLVDINATVSYNPSVGGWYDLDFDIPFNLTAGTLYWIVWKCSLQSTNNYWVIYSNTSNVYPYGYGAASINAGVSWSATSSDRVFKVWILYEPTTLKNCTIKNAVIK